MSGWSSNDVAGVDNAAPACSIQCGRAGLEGIYGVGFWVKGSEFRNTGFGVGVQGMRVEGWGSCSRVGGSNRGVIMLSLGAASKVVEVSECSSNDVAGVDAAAPACSVKSVWG